MGFGKKKTVQVPAPVAPSPEEDPVAKQRREEAVQKSAIATERQKGQLGNFFSTAQGAARVSEEAQAATSGVNFAEEQRRQQTEIASLQQGLRQSASQQRRNRK